MPASNNKQKALAMKKRAQKRKLIRLIIITAAIVIVAAAIVVGTIMYKTLKTYSRCELDRETQLGGTRDNLYYHDYADGYVQISNDGAVYFDKEGVLWDESFEMTHPIVDICKDYIAVADIKQTDVYIYDKSGLVNRISAAHDIIDVEISASGTVAISTNDNECNYIELKDINGNDLINVKSVFSASGYLSDITLSSDGNRLAAAFIYLSQGTLESKVLFYDFSKGNTNDMLVGGFSQYSDTVLTNVEFMNGNVVCALGDNALSFYKFETTPELISEELGLEWEIQTASLSESNILLVTKDTAGDKNYRAYVYDNSGKRVSDVGFDFAYSSAVIAGDNILLYSSTDCQIFSFKGLRRYSATIGDHITYILPLGRANRLLLSTGDSVRFIVLK